jgi:hypothetical protein
MGDKVVERPVFFLASLEHALLRAFRSDPTSTAQADLFQGQPLDFTPSQRLFLARHPRRGFVAALRALIEHRVLPAIERGPNPVDMHRLRNFAGRAVNQRRRAIADTCEQF